MSNPHDLSDASKASICLDQCLLRAGLLAQGRVLPIIEVLVIVGGVRKILPTDMDIFSIEQGSIPD